MSRCLNVRTIGIAALIIGFFVLLWYSGILHYFSLSAIQEHSIRLKVLVDQHYVYSVIVYILSCLLVVALAMPIAIPLNMLGGFLFGALLGATYATLGVVTGCILSFVTIRYLLRAIFKERVGNRLEGFNVRLTQHGPTYLLLFHYSAVFPYIVINSLAALTTMPLSTFCWVTILGVLPLSTIYTFAGRQLGTISSFKDIFSKEVSIALLLLVGLALLPLVIKRFKGPVEV